MVAFGLTLAGSVFADHLDEQAVEKRIKPSGSVYTEGDDVPVSKPAVAASTKLRTAEELYNTKCSACHATDAIGAPMLGNPASWTDRIAKGEETLITNAIKGFNAMPPKGTCGDCSDDEIKITVQYMVAKSQ